MRVRFRESAFPSWRRLLILGVIFLLGGISAASVQSEERDDSADAVVTPPGRIGFVGKNLFSTANGTFHQWRLLESRFDLESVEDIEAVVEVDLASVDTGIEARDEHLLEKDFFDIETYPVATVRAHSLVAKGLSDGGNPIFDVAFDVDLHGVEKTLQGEVEVVHQAPIVIEGRLSMNRLDFEIGPPDNRWNPLSIRAEIPLAFRVEL